MTDDISKEQLDRDDYLRAVHEFGMTHSDVLAMSENEADQIALPDGIDTVRVAPSLIQGSGLFAACNITCGTVIAPARIGVNRTPVGRFINHSVAPNCNMEVSHNRTIYLVATRTICADEELTVDYRQARGAASSVVLAELVENCFLDSVTRDKILALEAYLLTLPQAEVPLRHDFANGLYARSISITKGTLLTGAIHQEEHFCILSKGKVSVLAEGGPMTIEAPYLYTSYPSTKRVIFAHEDSVWTNIHTNPLNERDVEKLEERLVCTTYEQLDGAVEPLLIKAGS